MVFCCVKQKTAYEMRSSDLSSDVCSSDLDVNIILAQHVGDRRGADLELAERIEIDFVDRPAGREDVDHVAHQAHSSWIGSAGEIGRASCRARVCQYV